MQKDSISVFISNINHNIGDVVLSNNKFKLSNITMKCENNKCLFVVGMFQTLQMEMFYLQRS